MIPIQMTLAMVRVMALELWRDRAALVMTFLLPPLVFLIFSSVFAGATGEDIKPKLAVADMARTETTGRLTQALLASPEIRAEIVTPATVEAVRARVKSGQADAGLVLRSDPSVAGRPFLIIADPGRAVAAPLAQARVQQALVRAAPDAALRRSVDQIRPAIGDLTADQTDNLDMAASILKATPPKATEGDLFDREDLLGARKGGAVIAYYAGAVLILFALFSAMQGALGLMDERRTGVADRLLAGVAGMGPVITGKFVFLVGQGIVQAVAIFATAQLVYGVGVIQHIGLWLPTTLATAVCAAGLALGLVSICRTRDHPRAAPPAGAGRDRRHGRAGADLSRRGRRRTPPHAWVIDAYQGVLWRDATISEVYKAWGVLAAAGLAGLALAQTLARLSRR